MIIHMFSVNYRYILVLLVSFTLMVSSCRDESDDVMSYAYEDALNFIEANSSLKGQFKAIWTAMNCNYPIWDYEEQNGVNWDTVYEKYAPRFEKLDFEYDNLHPVPDSILYEIYNEMFAPIHDGHLSMYLMNIHTGKRISRIISPQVARFVSNQVDSLANLLELFYLGSFFKPTMKYYESNNEILELQQEEDYLFARFNDDIVYLRVPAFDLTDAFNGRSTNEKKERICKLWESWFDCVQNLYKDGSLKGIIIDVRNNVGGYSLDYQYVLGSLHYGNGDIGRMHHIIGYLREKNGIGRHDFSHLQPFALPINEKEHAAIEAPIVILANGLSASMSEMICLSAKQLKNGYVIGTTTIGAFSPSLDSSYAITYAGNVGDPALVSESEKGSYFASFFIDIPTTAFLSLDKRVIDGLGIVPDETVHLDYLVHQVSGKDNQLEKALEYIRKQ